MNLLGAVRSRLGWKIFLSYLIVIVVGVVVLAMAAELAVPTSFDRHLAGMDSMMVRTTRGRAASYGSPAASVTSVSMSVVLTKR